MTQQTYAATITQRDGCTVVEFPDFPGVVGVGEVAAAAVFAARLALEARLAGGDLPSPKAKAGPNDSSITVKAPPSEMKEGDEPD